VTYAQFLLLFLAGPIAALSVARRRARRGPDTAGTARVVGLITLAALLYTTPWDNYLVWRGVWTYGADRVVGTVGYVPVEEYVFFLLQPVLVGLLYLRLRAVDPPAPSPPPRGFRPALVGSWLLVAAAGVAMLVSGAPRLLYLGLILAWAAPVLAGMSVLGAAHVWTERRPALMTLAAASVYLWIADRTAIALGIWDISDRYSLGLDPLGLPVEEAVFFSLTTWLCVQGLAMLLPERAPVPA
jgi:lycopene cyclase domain-containing protein